MSETEHPALTATGLSLSMTVKDLATSVAWYTDVVGFVISHKFEHEGRLRSVRLSAGDMLILLNQDNGAKGIDRVKGTGVSFMLTTAMSVDAVADRIKAHGGTLLTEPKDMPWGARVFNIEDPDGYKWAISSERTAT